mmetsp:Transcript_23787/g.56255  ORF Transcript_23787/g.56255 Transcript_23787/m.56255 type:complete len:250 (-) Transcript_23787:86-835(-)
MKHPFSLTPVVGLILFSGIGHICSPNHLNSATAFQIHNLNHDLHSVRQRNAKKIQCSGSRNDSDDSIGTKEDMNIVTKSSWYAVEWFGNAFGKKESSETVEPKSSSPKSLDETIKRINEDNDRYYFLSGEIDSLIYDADCVFADPFVSFSGRDRFVQNLQNLGSFITKYDARVLKYSPVTYEGSTPIIETKIMVKLELNLPWKPVLAWPWGVKYVIDPDTYLIKKHEESWNIEPLEGVKMIFRPSKVKI